MPEEGFLRRWARVKATGADPQEEAQARAPAPAPAANAAAGSAAAPWPWRRAGETLPAAPAHSGAGTDAPAAGAPSDVPGRASPTLDDVARLTPDSDFSIFVGQGVDKSVQRLALKKLFADPHFNVMDRLDMYMDDYNIPSPVSEEMLASLDHARSALRRFVEEPAAEVPADGAAEAIGAAQAAQQGTAPEGSAVPVPGAHPASAAPAAPAALSNNEAAPAAPYGAAAHDNGPFHRPHQHLPESQA